MVDYTEGDLKSARAIVDQLSITEAGRQRFEKLEDGISITDLQTNAEQFYRDLNLLEDMKLDVPALLLGHDRPVPVALAEVIAGDPWRRDPWHRYLDDLPGYYSFRELIFYEMDRWRTRGGGATTLSPEVARHIFLSLASEFLASHFAGQRMAAAQRSSFISRAGKFLASQWQRIAGGTSGQPPSVFKMPKYFGGPPTEVPAACFPFIQTRRDSPHTGLEPILSPQTTMVGRQLRRRVHFRLVLTSLA